MFMKLIFFKCDKLKKIDTFGCLETFYKFYLI